MHAVPKEVQTIWSEVRNGPKSNCVGKGKRCLFTFRNRLRRSEQLQLHTIELATISERNLALDDVLPPQLTSGQNQSNSNHEAAAASYSGAKRRGKPWRRGKHADCRESTT